MKNDHSSIPAKTEIAYTLLSDFKLFCRYFFQVLQNGQFSEPTHIPIIQDALIDCYFQRTQYLNINVYPGSYKSTLLIMFVAWALARDPRCSFIYASYSFTLAESKTHAIYRLITHAEYQDLFFTRIERTQSSKSNFLTTAGGGVIAAGTGGTITGFDAGKPFIKGFSGAGILDDPIKPDDAFSSTMRNRVEQFYYGTFLNRMRSNTTALISIAQRTHESDLSTVFLGKKDSKPWRNITLPFINPKGTEVLDSNRMSLENAIAMRDNPRTSYFFASQFMQSPTHVGDSLFQREDFKILKEMPKIETIFITGDVAETDNMSNDATVFSCWGLFSTMFGDYTSMQKCLLWMDCVEIWVNPDILVDSFANFYGSIESRFGKVNQVRIENKSMGVMLNSYLRDMPGVASFPIIRNNKMSKMDRISQAQPKIKNGLICLMDDASHKDMVISHMEKITKQGSHNLDDIADTLADAVSLVYFDGVFDDNVIDNKDFEVYYNEFKTKMSSFKPIGKPRDARH